MDEDHIEYEVVCRLTPSERDQLALAMQWPEDREAYRKLITPTNLGELTCLS